jgi:predicted lipoprotein with Yx(FWY)xxD motif
MRLRIGRRVAVALTVPAVAVAGVLLAAGVATGSSTLAPNAAATDTTGGGATGGATGQTTGGTTGGTTATATGTGATSPGSKSPTKASTSASASSSGPGSPSASPSTRSPSGSASAAPTTSAPGGASPGAVAGGAGANCSNHDQPVTLQVGTAGGKSNVIVDASGCALYLFTPDTPSTTACTGQCAIDFPPAHAPGTAGSGVQASSLGTFIRPDGVIQVTLAGHQLYYARSDVAPGQANAEGQNGTWFLVDAQGNAVQP